MDRYDEGYAKEVEREVEALRAEALRLVQQTHPEIEHAVDRRSIDDYCERVWDYPGQWYLYFKLPGGFRRKEELILAIAEETVRYHTKSKAEPGAAKSASEPRAKEKARITQGLPGRILSLLRGKRGGGRSTSA